LDILNRMPSRVAHGAFDNRTLALGDRREGEETNQDQAYDDDTQGSAPQDAWLSR
jgi:hypothetical protein